MINGLTIQGPWRAWLVFFSIVWLVIPGCVPAKLSGYAPHGSGTLERRYCAGPNVADALRVDAGSGVRVDIRAGQNHRNGTITLDIRLTVPEKVVVQLLSSDLVLESMEWSKPRVLPIDRILGSGTKPGPNSYAPTDKLSGSAISPGLFSLWFLKGEKGTTFQTGIPKVNFFTMALPSLSINEQVFHFDRLSFEAYEKLSFYTCVQ